MVGYRRGGERTGQVKHACRLWTVLILEGAPWVPQAVMSYGTWRFVRQQSDKPIVWPQGEVKTLPFSQTARLEVGQLLRRLQRGGVVGMPQSRPMPIDRRELS